jgi:hypothetical protein
MKQQSRNYECRKCGQLVPVTLSKEPPHMTTKEKMLQAEERGSRWLADGNEAEERGNRAKAEKCFAKAQYWLDRYNKLAGNN